MSTIVTRAGKGTALTFTEADANWTNLNTDKADKASPTFTGTVVLPATTSIADVSATEIAYLDGVTSAIQTQITAKAATASPTFTGTVVIPTPFTLGATSVTATGTELNYTDVTTLGAQQASKCVTTDANVNSGVSKITALHIGTSGSETQVTATAAELNYLDLAALGTGAASKAVVLDSGDDYVWPAAGILTYGILKDPAGTALTPTHIELNYVDGVTSAIQTQIDTKAPIASPTFTGVPLSTTAAVNVNTTQIATTAYVITALKDSEIVTATNDNISAVESGKIFFLNSATEFVSTLPAPAQGLRYTFIVTAAPSGASYTVITNASANIIIGQQQSVAGDAGDFGTADDTITFVDGQSVAGDRVDVISDGTSWFAYAQSKVAAGITFTQASA